MDQSISGYKASTEPAYCAQNEALPLFFPFCRWVQSDMKVKMAYETTKKFIAGAKMHTDFKTTGQLSPTLHQGNNDRGITRFNVTISSRRTSKYFFGGVEAA